jgi:hypothetical protein
MSLRHSSHATVLAPAIVLVGTVGCHHGDGTSRSKPAAASALVATAKVPLDRLLPGELSTSSQLVFGFPVPSGMTIERTFPDEVHLAGEVTVSGLSDYIRKHAEVGAPELAGAILRFDHAHILNQDKTRQYRFEITQRGRLVRLLIMDMTPPPVQPGLSDEERWRQAGRKPNGEPLDISSLR